MNAFPCFARKGMTDLPNYQINQIFEKKTGYQRDLAGGNLGANSLSSQFGKFCNSVIWSTPSPSTTEARA